MLYDDITESLSGLDIVSRVVKCTCSFTVFFFKCSGYFHSVCTADSKFGVRVSTLTIFTEYPINLLVQLTSHDALYQGMKLEAELCFIESLE